MKKNQQFKTLVLCLLAFVCMGTINSQTAIYQLPNGGFETWYRETTNAGSIVPTGFHSFYSATGSLASMSQAQRCDSSRDVRSGATGIYSVKLYSNMVLGLVRANGNLTTGRIYASNMSASNAGNYNYTEVPTYCQEITGTPDSLRFWVKYLPGRNGTTNTTDKGRIRIYVHGTGECRDAPDYEAGVVETQYYYGKAMREFYKEDGGWHSYQVPFNYNGTNIQKNTNGNYYVLISMTTNAEAGGGANNADQAWFDDVEFIYSAWLADLKVNGQTIDGFQKNLLKYGGPTLTGQPPYAFPYPTSAFTYTPEVPDISGVVVENVNGPGGDADGGYTSIKVTAEDGVTVKEYRMYYYLNLSGNNTATAMSYKFEGEAPIPVPGFTPSVSNYPILIGNPEEVRVPQIVAESIVLADPTAHIQNIIQPTGVNSTGKVIVQAENFSTKSYNLIFTKTPSTNSKLNWIKVANADLPGFDPNVLEYNYTMTACVTSIPTVTYEKSSVWAEVNYTAATLTNRTATIIVKAEDNTTTTYKVNFVLTSNDVKFTNIRFGTSSTNQMAFVAGKTVYESAYSFTSAPNALAMTLSCTGATVNKFPATNVFNPDTNYFTVTAQDGTTIETYKAIIKNTNYALTTGANNAFRFNYNGLVNQNTAINITSSNNGNTTLVTTTVVTLPVGPNVPPELVILPTGLAASAAPPTYTIVQPAHRNDTAIVTITANDGITKKIYRVPFKATLSTDATLKSMTYDGFSVPGFNPATELYTLIFPSNVTEVPEMDYLPNFQWLPEENIAYFPAASLTDTTLIVVTAENGTTKKTYKIAFEVVEQAKDAYLTDIRYDNTTIADFNPTHYTYTEDVPYSAPTPPQVVPYASSPTALVFPSMQLNVPPYTQSFLVYSEDMSVQRIYTVHFNLVKNTNPYLADIKINGISLQEFDSQVFEYDFEFPYTEMNAPVVTATPAYQYAHVVIQQIDTIQGTVTINVTAEDDVFTEEYTIHFSRILSPVLTLETINYDYNNESYTYQVTDNDNEFTIPLPVETEGEPFITNILQTDARAIAEIVEQPAENNDFTGTISVTAEDLTEETYSVIFERTLSSSTLLTGIFYNGTPVPNFHPDTLTYYILLDYNTSQIQNVTATAAWKNTNVEITQASQVFGQATVSVTSEKGDATKTYTIIFQREGVAHLLALSYNLEGEIIPVPGFNPSNLVYNILLDYATTAVPTLEYLLEDNRCSVETIAQTTPTGTSELKIVTWNLSDSLTYKVNFTVELSLEAILDDLLVDGVSIANFNVGTLQYSYPEFPYEKEDFPVVTAVAHYPDATVEITQISGYPQTATVLVTAGEPTITQTYTVSFSRHLGNNIYLESLLIGEYPWYQFDKNEHFYTYETPYGITELPAVDGIPEDATSIVTVVPEYPNYQFGDTVKVIVTALNGDVGIYYVYFPAPKNTNAYASMIYVDWKPLEGFVRYIYEYDYELPEGYTGCPLINVVTEDPNATSCIIFSDTLPLIATITVTAEDGEHSSDYTIFFNKLSINTYTDGVKINVYPNPASDILHFEINELGQASSLEIYSIEGKKVAGHTLQTGNNPLNVSHLQKGIYIYKIFSDQTLLGVGKFIKN